MNNYDLSAAPASGTKADEFRLKSGGHPSWGHFANDEDDTRWFSDLYIPSWAIFVFGLGLGVAFSWLVL